MENITSTNSQFLISLNLDELVGLAGALNEVINNSDIDLNNCSTRVGINFDQLEEVHASTIQILNEKDKKDGEVFEAWRDGESIQIRAISAYGDPADLGYQEVEETIKNLIKENDEA